MNDKAWNVHRTNAKHLESLLNEHAAKGYSLHHIRGISLNQNGEHLLVVFRNEAIEAMTVHAAMSPRGRQIVDAALEALQVEAIEKDMSQLCELTTGAEG